MKSAKIIITATILSLFTATIATAGLAQAAITPTLSLSTAGGDSVNVSVSADPNANVMFYYNVASASGMQTMTLGTTNSSGYFSTTLNAGSYNINSGQSVYVIVDGAQSAMQAWPSPTGTPTLNESSLTVGLGQSASVYSQGSSAAIYMSTNSDPSVATVQTNGTEITVTGEQTGSTNAEICYTGTAANCVNLYITVQAGSVLSFSENNFTVAVGQGTTVTVSGGSGSYSITSNSQPSIASAILSGNSISISPLEVGTTDVDVCDTDGNCGTLYITVGSSSSNGSIYFSSTNPTMTIGQIINVTVSGGSGYYVTGDSNPSVASQSFSGSTLTISAITDGSTAITVCSNSNGCGTLDVSVGSSGTSGGDVVFGVSNPTLTVGQSLNVSLSGASSYDVSSNSNTNISETSINGSTLDLYGENEGSDVLTVCATGGSCNTLSISVTGSTASTVGTTSNNASLLSTIQSMQSQLAQIVTQIQSMATTLNQLASSAGVTSGTTTATSGSTSDLYDFTQFLGVGSQNADVTALQQYLTQKGFFSGPITGYFGTETQAAVEAYQTAHGIEAVGYVGPSTRAALNAGE
jgi:hypothetical protein